MPKTIYTAIRSIAIVCLILAFALSVAWATTYYTSKNIDGMGGAIVINSNAKVSIPEGALTGYLKEQNQDSVEITVEMNEMYDNQGHLSALVFTFGPSGVYFDPPLELRLKRYYMLANYLLFDENGEALEYTTQGNGNLITFYVPHFSKYSYDDYSYGSKK